MQFKCSGIGCYLLALSIITTIITGIGCWGCYLEDDIYICSQPYTYEENGACMLPECETDRYCVSPPVPAERIPHICAYASEWLLAFIIAASILVVIMCIIGWVKYRVEKPPLVLGPLTITLHA